MRYILYKRSLVCVIMLFLIGLSVTSSMGGYIENTSNQLTNEASASFPLNIGLIAYWAFDEGSGNTAGDSSGHGYDGTIYGATWTTGYSDDALDFDGTDDYVDLGAHSENLGVNKTDDYIISAYFKSTSSGTGSIYSMSHTDVARAFAYLDLNADGTLSYKTGDETCLFEIATTGAYNDGDWHKVEVKFYGDATDPTCELYVDGSLKDSTTEWLCPYLAEDFKTAKIGSRSASATNYFDGTIDEVKIFKKAEGESDPPSKPTITGPSQGNAGTTYDFTFTSTDPQDYDIAYFIEWGDGKTDGWTTFQASGTPYTKGHSWDSDGTYIIKAMAKNTDGKVSEVAQKQIIIPRNRAVNINNLFLRFLEQHINIFPILRYLLGI